MDEKISKLFLPLIDKLYNTEPAGEPFRKPVDVVKYGCYDYYLYVKHPIDLSSIREKLIKHQYKGDAWRFIADVQLMFSNAYLFNKKGTPVYDFTNKLNKIWTSELSPVMQRLNYCCGTLLKFGPQLLFCHGTTPDRYCQIPIGAKYKCHQDLYSFCVPCFNKIETEFINIQNLSCETTRMKLPTQPVKKSDFIDCTNDNWQYESFIQCTDCSRRIHQICELYPANEDEIEECIQHEQIEYEQKMLCQVPEEYRDATSPAPGAEETTTTTTKHELEPAQTYSTTETATSQVKEELSKSQDLASKTNSESALRDREQQGDGANQAKKDLLVSASLDDELLQFARDVEETHMNSAPGSPNPDESRSRFDSAKENCQKRMITSGINGERLSNSRIVSLSHQGCHLPNSKNSVDRIAARLSINKLGAEAQADETHKLIDSSVVLARDRFVCNHCYRKKRIGFNLRHRKYSARRLPHTRMSRYIETKVNEHIRENSPSAGEVTIRVLTAYRDTVEVKSKMSEYINMCRNREGPYHPNLKDYPQEFGFTNRAIFAWQEIDGVDVCVFGMHVQEYGEDCPEPNRQVVYLSYLDSVHFFRPKQVRTAVYHEILLSYFKYVKKLGFRRVFIWVCPSRKGDDYIFYRHPTEQKMPTLKRLSDWYVNLLDKGIMAGIVERHQNIYQYASSQNWTSLMSMPYLSGDYWPSEFERLLKIMIESQKEYEAKLQQLQPDKKDFVETAKSIEEFSGINSPTIEQPNDRLNMLSLTNIYQRQPPSSNGKALSIKTSLMGTLGLRASSGPSGVCFTPEGDLSNISFGEDAKFPGPFTPESIRSDSEQPLDLSKSSYNTSPESYFDDDRMSELSFKEGNSQRKKRRKSCNMGYTKKRSRTSSNAQARANVSSQGPLVIDSRYYGQPPRSIRSKASTQNTKDPLNPDTMLDPEERLVKNLERSLKRQKEGFIVARLNECDCSPHFEGQRRREEATFTCDLMKGREPFLQLARLKNYEFSTLRRAKFSSLAMVKHLGKLFKLDPICNECYSFDSSKRHYACPHCEDYYLCTSCHENTHHEHIMSLMAPSTLPDIDEFLQQCSLASAANSISSASSTISNKSFNESPMDTSSQSLDPAMKEEMPETDSGSPLHRQLSNAPLYLTNMPLGCKKQKNREYGPNLRSRAEDEENANLDAFGSSTKLGSSNQLSPPPSHLASSARGPTSIQIELDQVLVENFMRQAEVTYNVDFEQMKNESKKLLSHYRDCPLKETCNRCKFVVLSCSFMSVLMRSTRMQMMVNCNPSTEVLPNISNSNHPSGVNLTTAHRFGYQPKDK